MGTNYYFMSRNKELIHLNKLSYGWRPLFQKHIEYEKTLQKARQKFGVYEREYGDIKYWNDPDYLFDWTEGEFM